MLRGDAMSDNLIVCNVIGKGRGLFANDSFSTHTVITWGPVISLRCGSLDGTLLENHCWRDGGMDHLTLGPLTLCNHSDHPNCRSEVEGGIDRLIALRDIASGEELTLDYRQFEAESA